MKLSTLLLLTIFTLTSALSSAQVSDLELKKYVVVMDSITTLKNHLTAKMNDLATSNSKISPSRFNALMPVIDNQVRLTELKATPDEIAIIKKVAAVRDEETRKFQQTYQSLITGYIGSDVFTKVRNGLKSDTTLKKKYDSLMVKPIRP